MKKIRSRAISVILLAVLVAAGLFQFVREEYIHGRKWAMTFSLFDQEASGTLLDRNGVMLATFDKENHLYAPDALTRTANYHVTGDYVGMTGTGLLTRLWGSAENYNFITGTTSGRKGTISLTIDAEANNYAYELLRKNGKGTVMILNYRTGEVLCLVSSPSVDPVYPDDEPEEGCYVNRALTSTYTPGSTFKLVTAAAAIETLPDLDSMTFTCWGEYDIAGIKITCEEAHGQQTFAEALSNSCNCAFAQITVKTGQASMVRHVTDYGFLTGHTLDGIYTSAGNYPTEFVGDPELAWSGIGQSTDQVCPYTLLRYVAAIANDGVLVEPTFLPGNIRSRTTDLIRPSTAKRLQELMRNNVENHYKEHMDFPGLALCAKTGTAETGAGTSHSWFTGFLQDEEHPYAFVAIVEEGGYGLWTAGLMINDIFQYMIQDTPND